MKLSKQGIDFIASHEGLKLYPYFDVGNIPTIGYGNTFYPDGTKVMMSDPEITKEEALSLFTETLIKFSAGVDKLVKSKVNQAHFDMLTSFAYNVGLNALKNSSLLKLVNNDPLHPGIAAEFCKWHKAGGKPIRGLTNRRLKEAYTYYFGYTESA